MKKVVFVLAIVLCGVVVLMLNLGADHGSFGFLPSPQAAQTAYIIAASSLAGVTLVLFLLFGRDRQPTVTEAFYPPAGITPAEAGYIADKTVTNGDVVSLLLYWASKGYLSIYKSRSGDGSVDFTFRMLRELPPEAKKYEKQMFLYLFTTGDEISTPQLKLHFHSTMDNTKALISEAYSRKDTRLYSPAPRAIGRALILLSVLLVWSFLLITLNATYVIGDTIYYSLLGPLGLSLPPILIRRVTKRWRGMSRGACAAMLAAGVILTAAAAAVYVLFMSRRGLLVPGLAVAGAAVFVSILTGFMRKHTRVGFALLEKLLGYKAFITHADKSRVEHLVQDNPAYFYDVLAYASNFGVIGKWVAFFEDITVSAPEWYHSGDEQEAYSPALFAASLFRAMALNDNNMYSKSIRSAKYADGSDTQVPGGGIKGGGFPGNHYINSGGGRTPGGFI